MISGEMKKDAQPKTVPASAAHKYFFEAGVGTVCFFISVHENPRNLKISEENTTLSPTAEAKFLPEASIGNEAKTRRAPTIQLIRPTSFPTYANLLIRFIIREQSPKYKKKKP